MRSTPDHHRQEHASTECNTEDRKRPFLELFAPVGRVLYLVLKLVEISGEHGPRLLDVPFSLVCSFTHSTFSLTDRMVLSGAGWTYLMRVRPAWTATKAPTAVTIPTMKLASQGAITISNAREAVRRRKPSA